VLGPFAIGVSDRQKTISALFAEPIYGPLEEQEPVPRTGERPLAFRSDIGIPSEQAKALINELP